MSDEVISKCERIAIEAKYNGKKVEDIVKQIQEETGKEYSRSMIYQWFQEGGKLFEEYIYYAEEQNTLREKKSRVDIKSMVNRAVKVYEDTMEELINVKIVCPNCKEEFEKNVNIPSKSRITAAKEILDRVLGKTPDIVNSNVTLNPYDKLEDDDIDKQIEDIEGEIKDSEGGETTEG